MANASTIKELPIFDVKRITALEKSPSLPSRSCSFPSSNICRKISNTDECAFSISSNSTIAYGFCLILFTSKPPSSYPTYPGGAPYNNAAECSSLNSDMSKRISEVSSLKRNSARVFASSVFPVPVGPRKKNDPIG